MTRGKLRSVRFGSSRLRAFYVIGAGVWLSGGLWLLFHYFLTRQGEFGPQSNPLEPWWLKLHGAFAFAATWLFGLIWGTHITVAWPAGRRRLTGAILTAVIVLLIASGYLLYYVGNDTARSILSVAHWAIGLACPLLYWLHRKRKKARKRGNRVLPGMLDHASLVHPVLNEHSRRHTRQNPPVTPGATRDEDAYQHRPNRSPVQR